MSALVSSGRRAAASLAGGSHQGGGGLTHSGSFCLPPGQPTRGWRACDTRAATWDSRMGGREGGCWHTRLVILQSARLQPMPPASPSSAHLAP